MAASPYAGKIMIRYRLLGGLLLVTSVSYAALFFAVESVSARDYSGIADPQLRVGYCMVANTTLPEKHLLAESSARPEDLEVIAVVMSRALSGEATETKEAAIRALRERGELRMRAIRASFRVAEYCSYRLVSWPPGVTPLDTSLKWLRYDATYSFFLEKTRAEPDAVDRLYGERGGPKTSERGTNT
jgi:hypothetical protein